jgi:hypothetical protein
MILPPFSVKGHGKTEFRCLAFAGVIISERFRERLPGKGPTATCGLYLPSARQDPCYWIMVYRQTCKNGPGYNTSRLDQGVASAFLYAQTCHRIPPSAWRLYPLKAGDHSSPAYRRERRLATDVLWTYRMKAGASNEDLKYAYANPFFKWDASCGCFGVGIDDREDKEFEAAMLRKAHADREVR